MIVNGEELPLETLPASNLDALLRHYDLDPKALAIEYNGRILPRKDWKDLELQAEDRLELIRFVGGG